MPKDIQDLQIKITYLENLHAELNEVVIKLQDENMHFKNEISKIKKHMKNSISDNINGEEISLFEQLANEKPPHY